MTIQIGVKAFLKNKDGKYLLLKRLASKYPDIKGVWDIVGGRIEPGTTLLENLKREVKEETGLEIISEPRLLVAQDIMTSDKEHVVRLTYVADTVGEPVLDIDENVDYRWLTKDEIRVKPDLDIYAKEVLKSGLI